MGIRHLDPLVLCEDSRSPLTGLARLILANLTNWKTAAHRHRGSMRPSIDDLRVGGLILVRRQVPRTVFDWHAVPRLGKPESMLEIEFMTAGISFPKLTRLRC